LVEIEAVLDEEGVLRACRASGHALSGVAGADIVCAAISVLLRTILNTLSNREGIKVRSGAPEKGKLWLEADYEEAGKGFLYASGEFLINGVASVAKEYPQNCKLIIKNIDS